MKSPARSRWHPAEIGFASRLALADWGYGARLFARLVWPGSALLRRLRLVTDQIHFMGNYSLAIIMVSGTFVGFVLALQGYYTLQRYGSSEALGLLVALSLVRELGPVIAALLFAGRAGTSLTAEIGLMKAGEQLSAMEMMAVDPVRRILAPRFWGVRERAWYLVYLPLAPHQARRVGYTATTTIRNQRDPQNGRRRLPGQSQVCLRVG